MKLLLLIFTLAVFQSLGAQQFPIPDTVHLDSSSKLIGWYSHVDKAKTYGKWNFMVDKPEEIRKVLKLLIVGGETRNVFENPNFTISLVQNYREVIHCSVNPHFKCVQCGHKSYSFDAEKLMALSKAYPFDYTFSKIVFKTKDEYLSFLQRQKSDTAFLFAYAPTFTFEGWFELEFPRNNKFSSPSAVSKHLKPQIEKIVGENEYLLGYALSEKNVQDQTQYTMTINGSKKIYDLLALQKVKKGDWHPTEEVGYFFYKKK